MSMLDRYKKRGGFSLLLSLMETTGPEKRDKFFKLIADESPLWEKEIRKKMLTLDRVCSWNPTFLMEIFPYVPLPNIAVIMQALSPERQKLFYSAVDPKERRKLDEVLANMKPPSAGEVNSSVIKLFGEIRGLVLAGRLKFEKFDPEMVIPEEIEDILENGSSGSPPVSSMSSATPGASSEDTVQLQRKVQQLSIENQRLQAEIQTLREKLEQIRKIA